MSTAVSATPRAGVLDPDEQRVIEEARVRRLQRLARRELWSLAALHERLRRRRHGAGAATSRPTEHPGLGAVLVLIGAYAAAFRLEFEIGSGTAVPTRADPRPDAVRAADRLGAASPSRPASCSASSIECLRGDAAPRAPRAAPAERLARDRARRSCSGSPARGRRRSASGRSTWRRWPRSSRSTSRHRRPPVDRRSACRRSTTCGRWRSVYVIDAGLAPVGLAVAFAAQSSPYGVLLALPLIGLLSIFARERRVRIDHELELRDAYRGTAFLLGDVVEADDAYTGVHSRDVVELTLRVADELGLSARERRDAEFAALLHDVGKVRDPELDHQQARPARATRSAAVMRAPHDRGRAAAPARRRPARRDRARRPLVPRALGRQGLSRTGSPASRSRCWRGSSPAATPTTR